MNISSAHISLSISYLPCWRAIVACDIPIGKMMQPHHEYIARQVTLFSQVNELMRQFVPRLLLKVYAAVNERNTQKRPEKHRCKNKELLGKIHTRRKKYCFHLFSKRGVIQMYMQSFESLWESQRRILWIVEQNEGLIGPDGFSFENTISSANITCANITFTDIT